MVDVKSSRDETVLVLAPTGRDAPLTCSILHERAGILCRACMNIDQLCEEIEAGAGALVVAEETLDAPSTGRLLEVFTRQLPWSDLPLILLIRHADLAVPPSPMDVLRQRGNVTVLERPLRIVTLLSAVQAALRARRRQYEIRDLLAQARQAVRDRDHFLAMLGHELRNPLATIVNAMALLDIAHPPGDSAEREHREMITRQTRHLARLVDDLLDVERITNGKITLRRERLDLGKLVRRVARAVQGMAQAQHHSLTIRLPPQPVLIEADPVRLEQVISNLLSNAIKYTPSGGQIEMTVSAPGNAQAELRVRDNGIGIAPELLPRVFDLFTQAERSLDRAQGGMGIGLTLVRSLVELHGGTVQARSDGPDTGSEFTVTLPMVKRATEAAPHGVPASAASSAAQRQTPAPSPCNGRRRVLVIEDHDDARRSLQRLLQLWGHTVHVAADGQTGVSMAAEVRPDVALVDIGLPGLDGYEVARRIRAEAGDAIHLIALTGYGQPEDQHRAREAGFNLHLVKPVTADRLATTLERSSARPA